jgi:hypothetical protein
MGIGAISLSALAAAWYGGDSEAAKAEIYRQEGRK